MACDLLIRNGTLIDGTGAPARRADVAVAGGRIVEIGDPSRDSAGRVIDAAGLVVAPGFIDPHTHYDAQICWDGAVTPSSWHGVTSVVMGNCGVGIAPCRPEAREIAMRDLVNVEAIPFDVLDQGITWDWESFPQYLDAAAAAQARRSTSASSRRSRRSAITSWARRRWSGPHRRRRRRRSRRCSARRSTPARSASPGPSSTSTSASRAGRSPAATRAAAN